MADLKERQPRVDDPRFQRSLGALHEAVIALLEAQPVENISITALVQAAGVTRPTFYQHFADVPDAARHVALARLDAAFVEPVRFPETLQITADSIFDRVAAQALPVIEHLSRHRTFYRHVLDGAGTAAFFEEVIAFLAGRFLPDAFDLASRKGGATRDDLMTVMASGVMWLIVQWLRDQTSAEAPEAVARRIAAVSSAMIGGAGA